jgi:hypothetical protein
MRGGKREGAGRKPGSKNLETIVSDARLNGVDEELTPALAYLKRIVRGSIKNPDRHKIDAAKALLSYEAPRFGEMVPQEPPKSEEEILEGLRSQLANSEFTRLLVTAAFSTPEGQQSLALAILAHGYKLVKSEGAEVVPLSAVNA